MMAASIRPLLKALQALDEKYREKHAATRVLLSESYAEIGALLRITTFEEAQAREEGLKELQQRIYDYLRSDDEVKP
jgi:hypothetical protein